MSSSTDPFVSSHSQPERKPAKMHPARAATRAVHGRVPRRGHGAPLLAPIAQGATFAQEEPGAACAHTYSRASNPTVAELEDRLGAFEDALPALAFASGLAATQVLAFACLSAGDHAVVGRASYGGTVRLFAQILAPLGIRTSFVDASDARAVAAAIEPRTRLVLIETPANPALSLADIAAIAAVTRGSGALLAVDNTFLTAALQRPLDLGADVTLYSTTKWIEGHHATIGGALVTRDEALRTRLAFLRKSLGCIQAPFDAWLTLQGLKTLALRMEAHSEAALRVARAVEGHPALVRVIYPGLDGFPQRALALRQHRGGHGGIVTVELAGGRASATAFTRALRVATLAESLGGVETLATHPETMTHGDVPPAQRAATGITPGLVRLSIGLEDPEDLVDDIVGALDIAHDVEHDAVYGAAPTAAGEVTNVG
jgi:cystathionine beta-lyase/cystathionine gamma-synthase